MTAPGEGEQDAEKEVYSKNDIQIVFFHSTEITPGTFGSCGIPDKYSHWPCG